MPSGCGAGPEYGGYGGGSNDAFSVFGGGRPGGGGGGGGFLGNLIGAPFAGDPYGNAGGNLFGGDPFGGGAFGRSFGNPLEGGAPGGAYGDPFGGNGMGSVGGNMGNDQRTNTSLPPLPQLPPNAALGADTRGKFDTALRAFHRGATTYQTIARHIRCIKTMSRSDPARAGLASAAVKDLEASRQAMWRAAADCAKVAGAAHYDGTNQRAAFFAAWEQNAGDIVDGYGHVNPVDVARALLAGHAAAKRVTDTDSRKPAAKRRTARSRSPSPPRRPYRRGEDAERRMRIETQDMLARAQDEVRRLTSRANGEPSRPLNLPAWMGRGGGGSGGGAPPPPPPDYRNP